MDNLPLHVRRSGSFAEIEDSQENPIATVGLKNGGHKDAAFICQCVNEREELLKTLKLAHQCLESLMVGDENDYDAHKKQIEETVAKAGRK